MKKAAEKFGVVNAAVFVICCVFFLVNSIVITRNALLNISDNIIAAYVLNFFAGFEGTLGRLGSMSYVMCFEKLQLWRLFTHIYLHAGVIHMLMNLAALLVAGKYVEKRLGTVGYAAVFHAVAVLDAAVVSLFYTEIENVGASGGIFGVLGIAFVMLLKKQLRFSKGEAVYLVIFILISSVMGAETFLLHALAFVLGTVSGFFIIKNQPA